MPPRFYVPEARAEQTSIELPEDEAAHLRRVLRIAPGDHIRVFNGRGDEWNAQVDESSKHRVVARLHSRVQPTPEPRVQLTLAVAVLKGDKMDDIVRDAVMLGVAAIVPLITSRTELSRAALERSGRVARWQRIAVASAKQCGRAVVPAVRSPMMLDDVLRDTRGVVMLVEPSGAGTAGRLAQLPAIEHLTLLVGPEGGWSEEEVQRGRGSGAMLLTLGAHTLRADAVPIVALTALRVRLEDF